MTGFPHSVDHFMAMFDIPSNMIPQRNEWMALLERNNLTPAEQVRVDFLAQELAPYILDTDTFNRLTASMTALQVMWNNEIHVYVRNLQRQFALQGMWQSNRDYQINNMVILDANSISGAGGATNRFHNEMFVVQGTFANDGLNNTLVGRPAPIRLVDGNWIVNTPHWRQMSQQGPEGRPGVALERFRGDWVAGTFVSGDYVRDAETGLIFVVRYDVPSTTRSIRAANAHEHWMSANSFVATPIRPVNALMREGQVAWIGTGDAVTVERFQDNAWVPLNFRTSAAQVTTTPIAGISGNNVQTVLNNINNRVTTVTNGIDATVSEHNTRMGQLANLNNTFSGAQRNNLVAAANRNADRTTTLTTTVADNHASALAHTNNTATALRGEIRNVAGAVDDNTARISSVNTRVDGVSADIAATNSRTGNPVDLHARFTGNQRANLVAAINRNEARINAMESGDLGNNAARRDVANTFTGINTHDNALRINGTNQLRFRNGGSNAGGLRSSTDGLHIMGGSGTNSGPVISSSGHYSSDANVRLFATASGARAIDFISGSNPNATTETVNRVRISRSANGNFSLSTRRNNVVRTIMSVSDNSATPNFPSGLMINGSQIHTGRNAPSGASNGDIWFSIG
jgi:hypothetical protein